MQGTLDPAMKIPVVYNDTVVRRFAIMTVIWGIVGMLVGVVIAAELIWPDLNFGLSFLSYGRLRPFKSSRGAGSAESSTANASRSAREPSRAPRLPCRRRSPTRSMMRRSS